MIFNFREIFEVISVGIVLCEGEEIIENERVYSRVVNLDKWLKQILQEYDVFKVKERYILILGKYREECFFMIE